MFLCCGGSEGRKGKLSSCMHKGCDIDWRWWRKFLNVLALAEAGLRWNLETNSSPRNQPSMGQDACWGGRNLPPPWQSDPAKGHGKKIFPGRQSTVCHPEWRNVHREDRVRPRASALPSQRVLLTQLLVVSSLYFQSGLSLKLKWVSFGQHICGSWFF